MRRTIHTRGGPVHVERHPSNTTATFEFKGEGFRLTQRGPIYEILNMSGLRVLHKFRSWSDRHSAEFVAALWIIEFVGYQPGAGKAALKARLAGAPHRRRPLT